MLVYNHTEKSNKHNTLDQLMHQKQLNLHNIVVQCTVYVQGYEIYMYMYIHMYMCIWATS